MKPGTHIYDRRSPGKAITTKAAIRLSKALDAAYGSDACVVVLVPDSLHSSVRVHVSMPEFIPLMFFRCGPA